MRRYLLAHPLAAAVWAVIWRLAAFGVVGVAAVQLLRVDHTLRPELVLGIGVAVSVGWPLWTVYVLISQARRYRRFRAGPPRRA